ncbi:MAG: tRNA uridine-5-carboxymethylaminomethyl(34) synthesis GTPase MnmE [Bacteroidales bacterium]|jgi:tRNA modification GTPase|nr:tRNA uridine-5-carboxymethylaminomethyl(34) synthesis GTPase MnmE [Bacteroidales bacterium]
MHTFLQNDDTICATATASGKAALAVIRMSGPNAKNIINQIFTPVRSNENWAQEGYKLHYGAISNNSIHIDDVLVSVFSAPHSYTGEDSIEISCHGSLYIKNEILTLLLTHGARLAKAGEFTQRAYVNGKLDLSQAEAVADLIASSSRAAHRLAVSQMKGNYARELSDLRAQLLHFSAMLELELDFAEEDVEFANREELQKLAHKILARIHSLTNSFSMGNAIKNGIPVCIVGEPNVGKSTLLNTILNEEKAIVSDIPGTTRDVIEDTIIIGGATFRFMDTAGIRNTENHIEQLGINKTFSKIEHAAIVLLLVDVTSPMSYIKQNIAAIKQHINAHQNLVLVVNKIDLIPVQQREIQFNTPLTEQLGESNSIVYISAKKQENIHELTSILLEKTQLSNVGENDIILSNARHYECLQHAAESLTTVLEGLQQSVSNDLICIDLRHTLHAIGEITGSITNDETLGHIFKHFCIGK